MVPPPSRGLIPKAELRKIKQRVAKLRKQGHDIWTDDEVTAEGWVTEQSMKPDAGLALQRCAPTRATRSS